VRSLFGGAQRVTLRVMLVGERIVPGATDAFVRMADGPLVLAGRQRGCVVVFRYGVVVSCGMEPHEEHELLACLQVKEPIARPETETVELRIDGHADSGPRIEDGIVYVTDENVPRLQMIAEALAQDIDNDGRVDRKKARELLEHIGGALLSEQRMVGRVEVREKPEVLWDNAELERFYPRLEREYELRDRAAALERKLDLVSRTARTALELLQQRRMLRVEWYIVLLIVADILINLYGMWA
jgi:required for meiotic nuclear division protein 1